MIPNENIFEFNKFNYSISQLSSTDSPYLFYKINYNSGDI